MMFISFVKNRIRISLFALAITLLMSSNMYATAPGPIGVSSHFKVLSEDGGQAIALFIPETNTGKVLVKIKNNENNILFQKRVKVENGYAQKFNLKDLEDGKYQLIVTDKEKVVKQAFRIAGDKVWMSKSEKESFSHPTIQYNSGQKLMKVVSLNEKPIEVNIYDTKGHRILSESDGGTSSKAYNLSLLRRGEYTVEVVYGGEVRREVINW
ncbi:MAG: hypothetical protein ACPG49_02505 [Chitinophagales bacterium]